MKKKIVIWVKDWIFMLPGMPGRFRFFFAADLGSGFCWFPVEETLASSETVEESSKSTGMWKRHELRSFSLFPPTLFSLSLSLFVSFFLSYQSISFSVLLRFYFWERCKKWKVKTLVNYLFHLFVKMEKSQINECVLKKMACEIYAEPNECIIRSFIIFLLYMLRNQLAMYLVSWIWPYTFSFQ